MNKLERYENFKKHISLAAERFKQLDKKETIRLISHYDADGIASASILVKVMNYENRKYSISVVQQLNKKILNELRNEEYKIYMFSDLGSGQYDLIKDFLKDRKIFILDHHELKSKKIKNENIIQVNPHLFGIDGGTEISGAGVAYLFARELDKKMEDFAHIAIVGTMGDVQEYNGFKKLNDEILQTAIKRGKIKVERGPRFFGMQTKPLYKILEYCTDPYIPDVTGSESGAIQFLNQLGINPKTPTGWKKIMDLTEEEMKKLIAGMILKRIGQEKPEDVLTNIYILTKEKEGSQLREAREFATLLNACGRMEKASLGIGTCLGDEKMKRRAIRHIADYKKELINAIKWYEENKRSNDIISEQGFIIINAKDNVLGTIIGTLASILSKSTDIKEGTYIMSMAQLLDNTTKISLRKAGRKGGNLRIICEKISEKLDYVEYGGHKNAAGCLIPTEKEKEFIETAKIVLRDQVFEESIS